MTSEYTPIPEFAIVSRDALDRLHNLLYAAQRSSDAIRQQAINDARLELSNIREKSMRINEARVVTAGAGSTHTPDEIKMEPGLALESDEFIPAAKLNAVPKPVVEESDFDECAASGESCWYGPFGPKEEMQCRYCGKEQPVDLIARGMSWDDTMRLMKDACAQAGVIWSDSSPESTTINVMQRLANNAHKEGFRLGLERMKMSLAVPNDPMDWKLPCDVTVGHGTICKGVALRTLVTRMKVLYEMATGVDADEVANRTLEQRIELADAFRIKMGFKTKGEAISPQPPAAAQEPIDMVLHCPKCGLQHIDAPEEERSEDICEGPKVVDTVTVGWDNPPHRSHLCHGCCHIWRPADVPTNGVAAIKTKGKSDT